MTTKTYKYGKHTCKAYKKPAGKGYEVGFTMGSHQIFVGNFIHAKEANGWWTLMNQEIKKFSKKYGPSPKAPKAWYTKFLSNYVYKCYYNYLDREFAKYNRGFAQAVKKNERHFTSMKKAWVPEPKHTPYRRAA